MMTDYAAEFNRGPSKLADLTKYQPLYPRAFQAVKAGDIALIWGVKVQRGSANTGVVAYPKNAEMEGGAVLLENGEVKQMSAADFQSAPKAKK